MCSKSQILKLFMNSSFQTRFVMTSFERHVAVVNQSLLKPWRVLFRLEHLTDAIVQRDHACDTDFETAAMCDQTVCFERRRFGLKRCSIHLGTPSQRRTITCV
jgi:hypothetical protein